MSVSDGRSLWSVTALAGPALAELRGAAHAEVAIIGAGYTGLSAALHLAQGGKDVIVLEAADIGACASGLNGGQVIAGVKHDPDVLEGMFGAALGARLIATVAAGPDLVFDLIRAHAIECDAIRAGWLQPAATAQALELLARRVAQWQRRGAPVELLTRKQTADLLGSPRYHGSWIDRRGGSVQPLSYVRGLARAVLLAGSRIFCGSPALRLTRAAREWRIELPRGTVTSPVVILATNAYTGRLADDVRRSLISVASVQIATAPLPEALRRTVLPQGQAASDTCRLLRYFRLDASGRLVMGSRGTLAGTVRARDTRDHERAVREIFPQLAGVPVEYRWGGWVALTRDHLPHLHELAPGLLAGLGYNGRGVALATVMGRLLARRVLGAAVEELGFPVTPLRPIALHRCARLTARVGMQLLRALDALTRERMRPTHGLGSP